MARLRWVLALAIPAGCARSHPTDAPITPTPIAIADDDDGDGVPEPDPATLRSWLGDGRYAIRPGDHAPVRGAARPLVRIVVFEDFTSPQSAALAQAYGGALARWPDDVQIVLVQAPSSTHAMARSIAAFTIVAGGEGKFWEAHDLVLRSPPTDREALFTAAGELRLDVAAVREALADDRHRAWIDADRDNARSHGVVRGSAAFVNGVPAPRDPAAFGELVERERALAMRMVDGGVGRGRLHVRMAELLPAPTAAPSADPRFGDGVNWAVPAAGAPVLGPANALVTIVVFADFQCPFCARVQPTLAELRTRHPEDVRFVFRHMPLVMHRQARPAAKAAIAADRQGKFWAMHDALFAVGGRIDEKGVRKAAKMLRLDRRRFDRDRASAEVEAIVAEDERIAKAFGVRGTPAFFVNGRSLSGAQPLESFEAIVVEELAKAKAFAASDPGGAGTVYDRMLESFAVPPEPGAAGK